MAGRIPSIGRAEGWGQPFTSASRPLVLIGEERDMKAEIVIAHAAELVTTPPTTDTGRHGAHMNDLVVIPDGALTVAGGNILDVGPSEEVLDTAETDADTLFIDARGRTVMPGLVDAHTHLVWAGDRADEFHQRLAGADYETILAMGGGILNTVSATRACRTADLFAQAWHRLNRLLLTGTTTVEAKSGYGLDTDEEARHLLIADALSRHHPVNVVPTFLGAHAVPLDFAGRTDAYVDLVTDHMLPEIARRDLARYCDVFCERGVFDVEQSRRILGRARQLGFGLRVHADEFASIGATRLAMEMEAASADHLVKITPADIAALAASDTVAVLLPTTSFTLGHPYAPARDLIAAGACVALGSDLNPGTSAGGSMLFVMALACTAMKMTAAEALAAATVNAAWSLGLRRRVGTLDIGKRADVVVLDAPSHRHIAYAFGQVPVEAVLAGGRPVVMDGRLADWLVAPPSGV